MSTRLCGILHHIRTFEFDAEAGTGAIRIEAAVDEFQDLIEKHALDPNVIMEVFEMACRRNGTAEMSVNGRSRVR